MTLKLVLASKSPRRKSLLEQIGVFPDLIEDSNVNEFIDDSKILPKQRAILLARRKAEAVYEITKIKNSIILAADTIVAVGRRIVEKPNHEDDAVEALQLLSGRNHRVYTAVCLRDQNGRYISRLVETRIKFKRLSEEEFVSYIQSKEWYDKAGGYAIQGIAGSFVIKIIGSYSSVVGLPLYQTSNLLNGVGYDAKYRWKDK
ncbi:MAG: septum formation protein Maf [Rhodobiaceae bacterium]|nr:septum formation protein Maf [Rhodobiaceae bacterium]RPF97334.1 MAG: septum formation protein Maf [Rhizobiales bacterium TMED227]|tara:strand:- start:2 stop:607 length:606 start_codon:yes stop_codon:yes gene_type:complete